MAMAFSLGGNLASRADLDGDSRPFVIFYSLAQLDEYRQRHEGDFFNLTDEQYAQYTDAFFADNALLMLLTQGMSGSIRCCVTGYNAHVR